LESILNSIKESKLSSTKAYSKIFFSLETKYLAQEVGGWENKAKLGLALGVVYSPQIGFRVYKEESIEELLSILTRKNIVIGFNLKDFHFKVLEAYYKDWERIPIIDILEYAESKLSIRLPFAAFVEATLNKLPPLSGEEVVRLYRLGKEAEVEKNCCYKVKLLAELYEFAQKNKCLYYKTKDNLKFKLPWELS
jgi:DEAD/DEAH box helicase domain-containing protein